MLAEVRACLRELPRIGGDDEPRLAVVHDLERAPGIGCREHGLAGEERLEGHHAEVLVDRRVVDGEAACVQIGESVIVDAAGELDPAVDAGGEPLEPLAVGPFSRNDRAQARRRLHCLDQQVDPLRAVEPVHGEHI